MNLLQILQNQSALTMSSRDIANLLGSRHSDVMRSIDRLIEKSVIQGYTPTPYTLEQNGQTYYEYFVVKRDSYVIVAQLSPEFTAKLVDRWQELENKNNPMAIAATMNSQQLALLMAVTQEKEAAIATKSEIGSRREATAMNTASQAVKKVNALEIELDRSKRFSSVKRMEMLYHGQKFNWRELKSTCALMGLEPIDIFDANYGTVKAWPADVWREVYALEII